MVRRCDAPATIQVKLTGFKVCDKHFSILEIYDYDTISSGKCDVPLPKTYVEDTSSSLYMHVHSDVTGNEFRTDS